MFGCRCTTVYGTPTMFTDLLEAARAASPDLTR